MLPLRQLQKMRSVALIGGIILCLVLMLQMKQIWDNNQKHNRFLGYKQYVSEYSILTMTSQRLLPSDVLRTRRYLQLEEITAEMNTVERSANKSSAYVRQLNEALFKHREKEMKNFSIARMTTS